MRGTVRLVRRVLDTVAALLLVALLAVTSIRVLFRYVLDASMPWSEELTRLLFVWLVLIAAARARHMNIDMLANVLPRGQKRALDIGSALLSVILLAVLIRYALGLVQLTAGDRYTALGVSVQYLYWAVVVGSGFWIFTTLADIWLSRDEEPASVA